MNKIPTTTTFSAPADMDSTSSVGGLNPNSMPPASTTLAPSSGGFNNKIPTISF